MWLRVGVAGFGWLAEAVPWLPEVMRWGGAAFLVGYGVLAARSAFLGGGRLEAEGGGVQSLRVAVLTCLALTWLNPHVYLDTVLLVGGVSALHLGNANLAFALGAMTASFVWFFSLGYGAQHLRPFFARPMSWRLLDAVIALVMAAIALSLYLSAYGQLTN